MTSSIHSVIAWHAPCVDNNTFAGQNLATRCCILSELLEAMSSVLIQRKQQRCMQFSTAPIRDGFAANTDCILEPATLYTVMYCTRYLSKIYYY